MQVQVLQYEPHVECFETEYIADFESCKSLMQSVPASEETRIFGNRGQVDVELPQYFIDREKIP